MSQPVTVKRVFQSWWPLAASWGLMGLELPLVSAVVARLADPEVHLAAYGGVVFPLALIIESPIIMLLAASTALSKDFASYRKMRAFMHWTGGGLTALHALIAFTPLYDVVVVGVFSPPAAVVEPARLGLMIMLPWTWAIAFRRFNQGVLIRFGHARAITKGTFVRLLTNAAVLALGFWQQWPGIAAGASGVAASVIAEAVYVGWRVFPVIRQRLLPAPAVQPPLTLRGFIRFYAPLMATSFLLLFVQPLGAAAISRMPQALSSLAAWPVVSGFLFLLRSTCVAYNEVVVAMLEEPGAQGALRRFTGWLAAGTTVLLVVLVGTPLAKLWFEDVSGLRPELAAFARAGLWFGLLVPGLTAYQNWYQGAIVHHGRTRGVTEAMGAFLLVTGAILFAGIAWGTFDGLFVALFALAVGTAVQTGWLWWRSRAAFATLDAPGAP